MTHDPPGNETHPAAAPPAHSASAPTPDEWALARAVFQASSATTIARQEEKAARARLNAARRAHAAASRTLHTAQAHFSATYAALLETRPDAMELVSRVIQEEYRPPQGNPPREPNSVP